MGVLGRQLRTLPGLALAGPNPGRPEHSFPRAAKGPLEWVSNLPVFPTAEVMGRAGEGRAGQGTD